ncbi:hypothetical protein FHS85_003985 [Rhodoligotrophos appendicifer]|uniref:hypothetical protein n=1 Tax=Rhodoligotrophos appendicifer TaxID=987056 RepID=UPI001184C593|nr:hypothetical protein [Rhodoligotrophos appendicifer]
MKEERYAEQLKQFKIAFARFKEKFCEPETDFLHTLDDVERQAVETARPVVCAIEDGASLDIRSTQAVADVFF